MTIITVKTGGIAADAVTEAKIADDAVGTEHLTANEVDTTALKADAVTGAQLADNAVNSEHFTDGSVDTAHIADDQITAAKINNDIISGTTALAAIPATTDEFLISDAGTLKRIDAQFFQNTPAFSAYAGADQNNNSDNTWVKLVMNTEFYDTDGKYDHSTNYRFTPTIAGKYMFGASVFVDGNDTRDTTEIAFYKNGTKLFYASQSVDNDTKQQLTAVIELDSDDYVELYAYADLANNSVFAMNQDGTTSNNRAYWYGYKLIGA